MPYFNLYHKTTLYCDILIYTHTLCIYNYTYIIIHIYIYIGMYIYIYIYINIYTTLYRYHGILSKLGSIIILAP